MKNYDPNIYRGVHTIKITLQIWDYIGHVTQKIRGNCKGRNILSFDFECEDEFLDNDCQLTYHDDLDFFTCVLKKQKGDILEFEGDAEEMNNLIVGIEIIDFVEDKP